jgi:hypothetical protein
MARERVGAAAPWRWLQQAAALLRAHPRALLGGASLLVAMALLPSVATQLLASVLPGVAQVIGIGLLLLLFPPLVGGYFRLLHARASGQDWPPGAIFALFQDGASARRLILANIILVSLTMLLVTALATLLGGDALLAFFEQLSRLKPGASQLPPMPAGVLPFVLSMLPVGVLLGATQNLTAVELALGRRSVLGAVAAAAGAAWRNFGALLLLLVPAMFLAFLVFMLGALATVLLAALVSVASAALGQIVLMVYAVLATVVAYALVFGFFYFAWRELFDTPPAPPEAPHRIAV